MVTGVTETSPEKQARVYVFGRSERQETTVFEWSETDLMIRDAVRAFIDKEVRPNLDALDSGELLPYPILRKLFGQFGIDALGQDAVPKVLAKEAAGPSEGGQQPGSPLGDPQSIMAVLTREM